MIDVSRKQYIYKKGIERKFFHLRINYLHKLPCRFIKIWSKKIFNGKSLTLWKYIVDLLVIRNLFIGKLLKYIVDFWYVIRISCHFYIILYCNQYSYTYIKIFGYKYWYLNSFFMVRARSSHTMRALIHFHNYVTLLPWKACKGETVKTLFSFARIEWLR